MQSSQHYDVGIHSCSVAAVAAVASMTFEYMCVEQYAANQYLSLVSVCVVCLSSMHNVMALSTACIDLVLGCSVGV